MEEQHERYEELAVGHVLGGLDVADAAEFRSHLLRCRDCRLRVAELRDIAADLVAAERDERSRSRVRTEVERRTDEPEGPVEPSRRIGPRHVTVAAIVVLLIAAAVGFWNLHLRTTARAHEQVSTYRGQTLQELATGVPVEATLTDGVTGVVVVDDADVAFSFAGLPALSPGEQVVVWLIGTPVGDEPRMVVPGPNLEAGWLAGHTALDGAEGLVVTREPVGLADGPAGTELARVTFPGA